MMPPLNITEEPTEVPPVEGEEITTNWLIEHIWLPYVLLGLILIGMAVASFIHYHYQNRGKYADKKAHAANSRANTAARALKPMHKPKLIPKPSVSTRSTDISHKTDGKPEMIKAKQRNTTGTGSPDSSVSTAAYTNESYDSNCDSDKSLLSPEPGTSKTDNTKNKKRPRSRSPRRRTSSVGPAPPSNQKNIDMRKAKSMDLIHRDSTESSGSTQGSVTGADRRSIISSPPPSTARLETPVIPDNSRPRTQHKSRSGEVNVLKVHHEQGKDKRA